MPSQAVRSPWLISRSRFHSWIKFGLVVLPMRKRLAYPRGLTSPPYVFLVREPTVSHSLRSLRLSGGVM
jgi:hypothetical protein